MPTLQGLANDQVTQRRIRDCSTSAHDVDITCKLGVSSDQYQGICGRQVTKFVDLALF